MTSCSWKCFTNIYYHLYYSFSSQDSLFTLSLEVCIGYTSSYKGATEILFLLMQISRAKCSSWFSHPMLMMVCISTTLDFTVSREGGCISPRPRSTFTASQETKSLMHPIPCIRYSSFPGIVINSSQIVSIRKCDISWIAKCPRERTCNMLI